MWVADVKSKDDADELLIYMINNREEEWNNGRFIAHMEGMREQLPGRDFQEHKDWVFNNHSPKVPSLKEPPRVALVVLIRCCSKIIL